MTYKLRASGQLAIYPPLRWSEIQAMPPMLWDVDGVHPDRSRLLRLEVAVEERHTDDGVLAIRTAAVLHGDLGGDPWDEPAGSYVAAFIRAVSELPAQHTLTGAIYVEGEDQGDVRSYRPEVTPSGSIVTIQDDAVLMWSDGRRADVERTRAYAVGGPEVPYRTWGDDGDVLAPPRPSDYRGKPARADEIVRWLRDHEGRAVAGLVHDRLARGDADGGPE